MPLPLIIALVIVLALVLANVAAKSSPKVPVPLERKAMTAWIEEALARAIADAAKVSADGVLEALRGGPDPDVVSAVEAAVKSVGLRFEKLASGELEVRIDLAFEDGETRQATKRFAASDAPSDVTSELARTGAAFVVKAFDFPWKSEL